MELPSLLRSAVDAALEGVPAARLSEASQRLSARYRAELRDGSFHVSGDLAALAYLATRLPATYAATRAAMEMMAERRPGFAPTSLLDIGSGPGTALWAAHDCWPTCRDAVLVEGAGAMREQGETLAQALANTGAPVRTRWISADLAARSPAASLPSNLLPSSDLTTLCYVLDELEPAIRRQVVARLWERTADTLLIVEPGTPKGWERILAARQWLIEAGGYVVAPCPHALPCAIVAPDWCHFSRRVARSRVHRLAKEAEVPWEDERFIFIAVSRMPATERDEAIKARVIAPPRGSSGQIRLKLCKDDGTAGEVLVTRREKETFKIARRLDWGGSIAQQDGESPQVS